MATRFTRAESPSPQSGDVTVLLSSRPRVALGTAGETETQFRTRSVHRQT